MATARVYINKRVLIDDKLIWTTEDTGIEFHSYSSADAASQSMEERDELNEKYATPDMYYSCEMVH
jgi:hypothetical protein